MNMNMNKYPFWAAALRPKQINRSARDRG